MGKHIGLEERLKEFGYHDSIPFRELLAAISYNSRDELMWDEQGRMHRVWKLPPITDEALSGDIKLGWANRLSRVIDQYPDECSGQFIRLSHNDIAPILNRFVDIAAPQIEQDDSGFALALTESMLEVQNRGRRNGFFATISQEMLDKAAAEEASSIEDEELRQKHFAKLKEMPSNGAYALMHECYLVFTFTPTWVKGGFLKEKYKKLKAALEPQGLKHYYAEYENNLKRFKNAVKGIEMQLQKEGFEPEILSGQGIVDLLWHILNPGLSLEHSPPVYKPNMTIRGAIEEGFREIRNEQDVDMGKVVRAGNKKTPLPLGRVASESAVKTSPHGWEIDGYHFRAISALRYPPDTYSSMVLDAMRKAEGEGWCTVNFHVGTQSKYRSLIRSRSQLMSSQQKIGEMVPMFKPDKNEVATKERDIDNLRQATNPTNKDREKVADATISVIVRDRDVERLEHRCERIKREMWEGGYLENLRGDAFIHSSLPLNFMPSSAKQLKRSQSLLSSNIADMCPLYGCYTGVSDGKLLYNNTEGAPVFIDLFSTEVAAPHFLVTGGTGSGKSFFVNSVVNSFRLASPAVGKYPPGGKVFIIDRGGSYSGTCSSVGGEEITLVLQETEKHKPVCINPFYVESTKDGKFRKPNESELEYMLETLIQMLIAGTGEEGSQERVTQVERTDLLQALQDVFEKAESEVVLSDIVAELESRPGNGPELAKRLYAFTKRGLYGRLFDGPLEISWDNQFILVETAELGDSPAMGVIMFVLFAQIQSWLRSVKPRAVPALFLLDEAWKELGRSRATVDAVAAGYRELRKWGCSCGLISQDVGTFEALADMSKTAADGIVGNTRHFFLLGGQNTDVQALKRRFKDLTPEMEDSWMSCRSSPPFFSEIFYLMIHKKGPLVPSKIRLYSNPVGLWMASTDPHDVQARDDLRDKFVANGDPARTAMRKAIQTLAQEMPYGSRFKDMKPE